MDRTAKVGGAPLWVGLGDGSRVLMLSPYTIPPVCPPTRGPQTPGEGTVGARFTSFQLLTSPAWGLLCPKSALLNPRSHFPYDEKLQFSGPALTLSSDSASARWLEVFHVGVAKGLSDLQVGYLRHESSCSPSCPSFHQEGGGGRPWNMSPPPPGSEVAGFLRPLLGIWKSLGNLKKIFLKSLCIAPQALPGSHSQEEEGKEGSGGVGDQAESQKKSRARGEGGEHLGGPLQPA